MSETEIIQGLKHYFDETDINILATHKRLGKARFKEFDNALRELYKND